MMQSRTLKTIGRVLEAAGIADFKIKASGDVYRVCVARFEIALDQAAITRLRELVENTKDTNRQRETNQTRVSLSQQLRGLGNYLDRVEVEEFRILWNRNIALLDYESPSGEPRHRVFASEELRQLALQRPPPQSVSYLPPRFDYWS